MPELFPHQVKGAEFLAARTTALLADEQRVGKTAAAIRACDVILARFILVITKSSARGQWGREFREWGFPRDTQVIYSGSDRVRADAEVVIVGWGMVFSPSLLAQLLARRWDAVIPDECHEARNTGGKRAQALYGASEDGGLTWSHDSALVGCTDVTWPLSGTPIPNAPNDLYIFLRATAPERLLAGAGGDGSPDVTAEAAFTERYCVIKTKRIGGVLRNVIKGGKNLPELNKRVVGLWLRRTQKDVGIRPPIFSVFALTVDKLPPELREDADAQAVFDAVETGETKSLELHLGPIRRLTGVMKAHAVVHAATELLADRQIDKLVLMAWHGDVLDILWSGLAKKFGVVGIAGDTPPKQRDPIAQQFQKDPHKRVFVGQITAAGEAIDLSAAAELWFVESSFTPKDMSQAAMRITNHSQKRQALVRVCALAGSIDEAIQTILTRKVATIRELMK